jgi:putative peptide zinc metalloprotease protein
MLSRYAVAGLAWSGIAACFAVGMSLRYEPRLADVADKSVVWAGLIVLWFGFFVPLIVVLAGLLRQRRRRREA